MSHPVVSPTPRSLRGFPALVAALALALPVGVRAQAASRPSEWDPQQALAAKEFVTPPDRIAEAVLAPRYLNVSLTEISPDRLRFFHEIGDGPVTMDRFSKPFHELGGEFIDFRANRSRTLTIRSNVGLDVISATDGSRVHVEVPRGARVSNPVWSPDGSRLAYFVHTDDATHIYVADPGNGRSRAITRTPVLATMVTSFEWTSGGREIATILVPSGRSSMPVEPTVPQGPQVKRTEDGENRLRTYASLMATPHDEALLEWHATGQLAAIDVESRRARTIGQPAMIMGFDFSPDGEHARVTVMQKPFSYIVPVRNFGTVAQIWDRAGTALAEIETTPMDTGIRDPDQPANGGFGQDRAQRRQVGWLTDGTGLVFLEQEPAPEGDSASAEARPGRGGDGERARRKDRVMRWAPPFDEPSLSVLHESDTRMSEARFSADQGILFVNTRQGDTIHEYAVYLDQPDTTFTLVRYDSEEFYENPGSLVMDDGRVPASGRFARFRRSGSEGQETAVLLSDSGDHVFFYGQQYGRDPMEEGPRSFLDRIAIRTGEKERIYESGNEGLYEQIQAIVDVDEGRFVVSRETPRDVPQSFLRVGVDLRQLTRNEDYTPDLTGAPRERFTVERPDGFRFLVNVTLPPDHRPGTRLPAMFWFYPREYEDQESYDEGARTYNRNAFPDFGARSMEYLVRLGYAVVEPDAPIVGESGRMNNNYEHDLRNNLAAVIDELDRRGIIDRQRLGLGGHSYGAFSTVNAMVHTPFFKAGIAGDGNYNRTLTPLAFQNEDRILWEARDVYLGMSPFLYANHLTGALLLYHGLHDQNVGTDPIHSPRLFHALNGLGKEAAMYLYPFEDHGPATRETLLDLWARWSAWLDVHLAEEGELKPVTSDEDGR